MKQSIHEVVNTVGPGLAQLQTLVLGTGGVNFCDGIELMLGNICVMSISGTFDLSPNARAMMSVMTLLGLMGGHLLSGYIGDVWGRRPPVLWCYGLTASLGIACAFVPTFSWLVAARYFLGIGMGCGMPPANAMMSETTPAPYRIAARVGSAFSFSLGFLFVTLLAAFNDPEYRNLNWRYLMFVAALPSLVFWLVSYLFLQESPVYLAAVGRHEDAKKGFHAMARLNGTDHLDLDFGETEQSGVPGRPQGRLGLLEQLRVVFSSKLRYTTIVVFLSAFSINLVAYGDSYAAPQVLPTTGRLAPAWRFLIKAILSMTWSVFAGLLGQVLSRKTMMLLGTTVCSTVCFAFAVAGPYPTPRTLLISWLYQYGANCSPVGSALGYVVVFQVAVEIYPTAASATGGALIMGGGRMAAVLAPLLFENLRRLSGAWTHFYYVLGLTALLAAVLICFLPPIVAYKPGEGGSDIDVEADQLRNDARKGYGAVGKDSVKPRARAAA